jgi:hypothetical protein
MQQELHFVGLTACTLPGDTTAALLPRKQQCTNQTCSLQHAFVIKIYLFLPLTFLAVQASLACALWPFLGGPVQETFMLCHCRSLFSNFLAH